MALAIEKTNILLTKKQKTNWNTFLYFDKCDGEKDRTL